MKENTNQQTGEGNSPRDFELICKLTEQRNVAALAILTETRAELKMMQEINSAWAADCIKIKAQRDELLAALKAVQADYGYRMSANRFTHDIVNSAITKAEGRAYAASEPINGEQCIYCGKNSWECEHYEEANQE